MAKCFGRNLCAAHANMHRVDGRGERRAGRGAGTEAFNRSMDGCIDLAMPARAIDQLEKSRSEANPTEPNLNKCQINKMNRQ